MNTIHTSNGGQHIDTKAGTVIRLDTHRVTHARRRADHELEQHVTGNSSGSTGRDFAWFYGIDWALVRVVLIAAAIAALLVLVGAYLDPSYLPSIPSIHGVSR